MTEREEYILDLVVEEYVKTAMPVSSFHLIESYGLDFSSATIRNELASLEREGFLEHPYSSSGRIPTDKGYRHYVNKLLKREEFLKNYAMMARTVLGEIEQMKEIHLRLKLLLLQLSMASGNVVLGKLSNDIVFEEGLENLVKDPYFSDLEYLRKAFEDLEQVKDRMDELSVATKTGTYDLYIGKENPVKDLQGYSMIVGKCDFEGEDGTILLIGPKSMQYGKNIAYLDCIINSNKEYDDD
jgi:transcriptional regulator of heat shock response